MAKTWSVQQSKSFWQKRKFYLVTNDPDEVEKTVAYQLILEQQHEKEEHAKAEYLAKQTFSVERQDVVGVNQVVGISSDLLFWARYSSWTYCSTCNSLSSKILPYNFSTHPKNRSIKKGPCSDSHYMVPMHKNIPLVCILSSKIDKR